MSTENATTTPDLSTVASARAALVAALRSGEYKQHSGKLRSTAMGGYCCLGVAGDLLVKAGQAAWDGIGLYLTDDSQCAAWNYLFETYAPNPNPFGFTENEERRLADANDAGVPFSVIADLIEAAGTGPIHVTGEWIDTHRVEKEAAVSGV